MWKELNEYRQNLLNKKAKEYAIEKNRWVEFEWSARELNTTPQVHLLHLLHKHLYCIGVMRNNPAKPYHKDYIFEKFADALNYLELWDGMNRDYNVAPDPRTTIYRSELAEAFKKITQANNLC